MQFLTFAVNMQSTIYKEKLLKKKERIAEEVKDKVSCNGAAKALLTPQCHLLWRNKVLATYFEAIIPTFCPIFNIV